jgi:methionyl-tRNA formyltransferase
MKKLIIASSKPWNKKIIQSYFKRKKFDYYYVSTPDELNLKLKKITKLRYIFFLHWNWIVPPEIIREYECVCFHMTDLPYGRGGSPLQNLILNRKKKTMISSFKMKVGIDTGPIYAKKPLSLDGKAEDIYKRASEISCEIINWIIKKKPIPKPQSGKVTFFKRRRPGQSLLPKKQSLSNTHDFIRMLDAPTYPKAFINYGDLKFEFENSKLNNRIISAKVKIKKNI